MIGPLKPKKIEPFELRGCDILKFNAFFGYPFEEDKIEVDKDGKVKVNSNKIIFWAWRGYCFQNKLAPDREPTLMEYASMFSFKEILEHFKNYYMYRGEEKESIKKIAEEMKIKK